MKVVACEAIVENGEIRIVGAVQLPEHARVYVVVPEAHETPVIHVGSPRLARPEQVSDFLMKVALCSK